MKRRQWPLSLGALGPLLALVTGGAALGEPWESLYGRHVVAVFHERDRDYASLAVRVADPLVDRLERDFGFRLRERARITVCSSHEEFERAFGRRQGTWVLGMADLTRDTVYLKAEVRSRFPQVLSHELAHLFVGQALGDYSSRAPDWLHEGAAKYYAGDWSPAERGLLADAAREGRLLTISQLADFPTNPDRAAIAYAESYVLIAYLASLGPHPDLAGLITGLKETGEVERAFRRAYGLSEAEVEAGLTEAILRRSGGMPPMWAVDIAVFFAMALLFLFGYWRVRKRSKEIRERMEQEELLERLFEQSRRRRHLWGPRG